MSGSPPSLPGQQRPQLSTTNDKVTTTLQTHTSSSQPISADSDCHSHVTHAEAAATPHLAGAGAVLTEATLLPLVTQQLRTAYPGLDPSSPQFQALALQQTRVMLQELYNHNILPSMQNLNLHHAPDSSQSSTSSTIHHSEVTTSHKAQLPTAAPVPQQLVTKYKSQAVDKHNPVFAERAQSLLSANSHPVNTEPVSSTVVAKTRSKQNPWTQNKSTLPPTYNSEKGMGKTYSSLKMRGQALVAQLPNSREEQSIEEQVLTAVSPNPAQKLECRNQTGKEKTHQKNRSWKSREECERNKNSVPEYTPCSSENWDNEIQKFPDMQGKNFKTTSQSSHMSCTNYSSLTSDDWEDDIQPYPRRVIGFSRPLDTLIMSSVSNNATDSHGDKDATCNGIKKAQGDTASKTSCYSKPGKPLKEKKQKAVPCETPKAESSSAPVQPKAEQSHSQSWTKVGKQGKPKKKSQKQK